MKLARRCRAAPDGVAVPVTSSKNVARSHSTIRSAATGAEARNPKARYVLPIGGRLLVGLLGALPDGAADRVKRRGLGLGKSAA